MKRRKITSVNEIDFGTIQQGDVLLHLVDSIKGDKLTTNVVEEGEHTGHAHRLDESTEFEMLKVDNNERYLVTGEAALVPLRHEEHELIPLPKKKKFRISKVREFNPIDESLRPVLD